MIAAAHYPPDVVRAAVTRVFEVHGVPASAAAHAAAVLIDADVRGHASHGVSLLPTWLERIRRGGITPGAEPAVVEAQGPVTRLDARGGLGPVAAIDAAERCASTARRWGVGVVTVAGANHVGMLAAYREPFLNNDVVGLILNVSGPSVAPPNSIGPVLGNDAICLVVPRSEEAPLIADFACGIVACGKVRVAGARGERVPDTWLNDANGRPSTDPADLDAGGAVPLFGGHKGLCTALIAEVLAGMLGGGVVSPLVRRQRLHPSEPMNCAQTFLGFSRERFGSPNLATLVEVLANTIRRARPSDATGDFFPEQQERRATDEASAIGISVSEAVAATLGLDREGLRT